MSTYTIQQIYNLEELDLTELLQSSRKEGFRFLNRLVDDYQTGRNRFNQPGECLFGVFNTFGSLIAIGGLNQDPHLPEHKAGRLRRFYVLPSYRRNGIGRHLVMTLLAEAQRTFPLVVLHTDTLHGAQFYESLGFQTSNLPSASHIIRFDKTSSASS